ncbi:hypothetical protein PU560_05320, partial [Georgenia sp. 10Sc9-8]|nr:hypothetical protein [Georgenia halotolerans]
MEAGQKELRSAPPAAPERPPRREVLLVDVPPTRVRRPGDLVSLLLAVLGIVVVLVLAVYAHGTAQGVTEDVQSAVADVLRAVLLVPVTVLEGLLTFFVPVAVIVNRVARRSWRSIGEVLLSALAAAGLATLALWALNNYAPVALTVGLTITADGYAVIGMNPYVAALAGLLTTAGERKRQRSIRWWWNLLWVVLGLSVIQGEQTLPGAVVTVLVGRAAGLGVRYAMGVLHDRANGVTLVRGLRRGGIDAVRVVRLDPLPEGVEPQAWTVTTSAPLGYVESVRERSRRGPEEVAAEDEGEDTETGGTDGNGRTDEGADSDSAGSSTPAELLAAVDRDSAAASDSIAPDPLTDPRQVLQEVAASTPPALGRDGVHRVYAVWDTEGRRCDAIVLDGDQQVVGYLAGLWDGLRMRGLDR